MKALMLPVLTILLSLFPISCAPQSMSGLNIQNGSKGDPRFNGTLSLTVDGSPLCSASLLTPFHALTARHCVARIRTNLEIKSGENWSNPTASSRVKKVHILPVLEEAESESIQLNGDSWSAYDLAILELENPILSVIPYDLISRPYQWGEILGRFASGSTSSKVSIAGFGSTGEGPDQTLNTLRFHTQVDLSKIADGVAETRGDDTGACSGDSGGSILFQGSDPNQFSLGGALSTGTQCAKGKSIINTYGLSYPHICWIKKIITMNSQTSNFAPDISCTESGSVLTYDSEIDCGTASDPLESETLMSALAGYFSTQECETIRHGLASAESLNLLGLQLGKIDFRSNVSARQIDLSSNQISDLAFLSQLQSAHKINLSKNNIQDISAFNQLPLLESLDLDHNLVQHLTIQRLNSLQQISLFDNRIQSIPDIDILLNLRILNAGRNRIEHVGKLPLTLNNLNLSKNKIADVSFLTVLNNLEVLYLHGNEIESLKLSEKPNLAVVKLEENRIKSLEIDSLPKLIAVNFGDNPIQELKLGALPELLEIEADNAQLKEFPELFHLKKLQKLWLRNNSIGKFDVSRLPISLVQLELGWNTLKSIDGIEKLENLEILSLHGMDFESLSPLLALKKLKYVAVDDPDSRFTETIGELKKRGVEVDFSGSYGWPEADFLSLFIDLKSRFPQLNNQTISADEAIFLAGSSWYGRIINIRNPQIANDFSETLLREVFESVGEGYRLRSNLGNRIYRYHKSVLTRY